MTHVTSLTFPHGSLAADLVNQVETMFNKNGDPERLRWREDPDEPRTATSAYLYRHVKLGRGIDVILGVLHYVPVARSKSSRRKPEHYQVSFDYSPQDGSELPATRVAQGPTLASAMLSFIETAEAEMEDRLTFPAPLLELARAFLASALVVHFFNLANGIENAVVVRTPQTAKERAL